MDSTTALLLSILFGIIPMFFFACLVYWTDRYEREPLVLLGGVFLWGAIVAAGAAFLVNTTLGLGIYTLTASEAITNLTTSTIVAPLVEESLKGLAVLIVFLIFRKEFDSILDGIVYAAIAALGFAATENIYYIYNYGYAEYGLSGLLWLVFVRVILVGWQHPFYTAFIGIGIAIARLSKPIPIKVIVPVIGFTLALFTHASHNLLANLFQGWGGLALGTFIDWSGWAVMFLFILWALFREKEWLSTHLREEVSLGTITAAQYQASCSGIRQFLARTNALFSGQYRTTHRFYLLAAELAYKKQQLASLGDENGNSHIITKLRSDLATLSPQASV
jgi:RsiW-degrading membrane proteinase PrsW (M82 family)